MWTLVLASGLFGCTPQDPETRAAADYVTSAQPLMVENSLLAERLLQMAGMLHDKSKASDGITERWATEIVPLATHLSMQADNVDPPEEWEDEHTSLVVIWKDRATAYKTMGEALVVADRKVWKEARNLDASVVKREENWFLDTNKRLLPLGLSLDQYP